MKSAKECMQAAIDGETLVCNEEDFRLSENGHWIGRYTPTFAVPEVWSIKPKPRVIYVNEYITECDTSPYISEFNYNSLRAAKDAAFEDERYIRTIKFVEVIE